MYGRTQTLISYHLSSTSVSSSPELAPSLETATKLLIGITLFFAQIDRSGDVKHVFVHQSEVVTATNLKKSLLAHLRSKTPEKVCLQFFFLNFN